MTDLSLQPTDRAIREYHASLADLQARGVTNEMGVRDAFQTLLKSVAQRKKWALISEQVVAGVGHTARPDGTLYDANNFPRGHWEAKDTRDDLDQEIDKKRARKYPFDNIVFEDTRRAVLFQNNQRVADYDLTQAAQVARLLETFLNYAAPQVVKFEQAVERFSERTPELARGLQQRIEQAHKTNKTFKDAYATFFELCKTALNPNISRDAVDEMIIQHLLTERLMRTVFDNPDFARRNVIAAEIEKVIDALTSQSFSRQEYLRELDIFYSAIEDAARTITDFREKQAFINTIYERFFQGYAVKVADTHGIVYTPQPIVDFMCASVEEVLHDTFGKTLHDPDVYIIDPCTGTGNFIINLLHRIHTQAPDKLAEVYRERLFANEVMLMPYYIAALNIEHTYHDLAHAYAPFEGLCFVDTLDLAEGKQKKMAFVTEANTARVQRQKDAPITVIIGNPPYNVGQKNENDNNKNRKYGEHGVDDRIKTTYAKDSKATLRTQLYDPYVKFFRWASDRLQGRDGIVCYVTNNSFVDGLAFDGMRKNLLKDFTHVYHLDLGGNSRQTIAGANGNVFGIRVGVGITIAIQHKAHTERKLLYHRVPDGWRADEKLGYLREMVEKAGRHNALNTVTWRELQPDAKHNWLVPDNADAFESFLPMGTQAAKRAKGFDTPEAIFKTFSNGVKTNADVYIYDFGKAELTNRVQAMVDDYRTKLARWMLDGKPKNVESLIKVDEQVHKWIRHTKRTLARGIDVTYTNAKIRTSLYRPFTKKHYYFETYFNEDIYQFPRIFPTLTSESENRVIVTSDIGYRAGQFSCLITNHIPDLHLAASSDGHQCFPFYTYDEDGGNRRENITDWALAQFRAHYGDASISKWDIFYTVYAALHVPAYRQKYAANLKKELPRIPYAPDFHAYARAGQALAALHLNYETLTPYPLDYQWASGKPISYAVHDKMRLNRDKTALIVNPSLTLAGIPKAAFDYKLGNRSALEWVIDQYQVKTDKRSGITSDPNRYSDDPQYIVKLVGQVVQVSIETMGIVAGL